MPDFSAVQLAALAKRVARDYEGRHICRGTVLVVLDTGLHWVAGANLKVRSNEIMRAKITPENRESKDALVRSLLASRVTYDVGTYHDDTSYDIASLGPLGSCAGWYRIGPSKEAALAELLDALLAPTETLP